MKRARHLCNTCRKVFDCEPCQHKPSDDRAYCSAECTDKGREDTVGTQYVTYVTGENNLNYGNSRAVYSGLRGAAKGQRIVSKGLK